MAHPVTRPVITRKNIDQLLDHGEMEIAMTSGKWWNVRRNGRTQLWKTMPERIRIPIKYGFKFCSFIDEGDFIDGTLNPCHFRAKEQPTTD